MQFTEQKNIGLILPMIAGLTFFHRTYLNKHSLKCLLSTLAKKYHCTKNEVFH